MFALFDAKIIIENTKLRLEAGSPQKSHDRAAKNEDVPNAVCLGGLERVYSVGMVRHRNSTPINVVELCKFRWKKNCNFSLSISHARTHLSVHRPIASQKLWMQNVCSTTMSTWMRIGVTWRARAHSDCHSIRTHLQWMHVRMHWLLRMHAR